MVVLFSSVLWLVSALVLTQAITPRVKMADDLNTRAKLQVESLAGIHKLHGERVTKAKILKPLLEDRIDTVQIFSIALNLTNLVDGAVISRYGRETDGKFVFTVSTDDLVDVSQVLSNARKVSSTSDIELRTITQDSQTGIYSSVIALNILNQDLTQQPNGTL